MLTSLTPQEIQVKRFLAYCWKVIENSEKKIYSFLRQNEIGKIPNELLYETVAKNAINIRLIDTRFCVANMVIPVCDSDLAEVLNLLSEDQREIILRSFFLEETDQEIAGKMRLKRGKVNYQKMKAIENLRKWLKGGEKVET